MRGPADELHAPSVPGLWGRSHAGKRKWRTRQFEVLLGVQRGAGGRATVKGPASQSRFRGRVRRLDTLERLEGG